VLDAGFSEFLSMPDQTEPEVSPTLNEVLPSALPQQSTAPLTRSDLPVAPLSTSLPIVAGHMILDELGRGGMGVVYRARQAALNRIVALKMILSGSHSGDESRRRFRTEAEAVARLSHPNIVQVYEVGESDGAPYFSLEYVDGGSLEKRLREGPLPQREAAALVETLARAMHHAHEHGVIHRDLKPGNVLLARAGREPPLAAETGDFHPQLAKVTDFGLAKQLESDSQTQSGAVLGTPSYMAPEQAAGKVREIGPATDVYALGAILYECLTGQVPFKGDSTVDTLLLVLEQVPQRPRYLNRTIDAALEAICLKCLEKEPAQRYPSALALAEDLAAYQHGESVLADRSTNLRLLRVLWQESRHADVLIRSGRMWMAQGMLIFLVMLYGSILRWCGITHAAAYVLAAVSGLGGMIFLGWWFRMRDGPPLTLVEWQMVKILALTIICIALTVAINFLGGYAPMELFPLAVLQAGIGMGAVGIVLGGSFNFMPVVCIVMALILAWRPETGPIVFGIGFGSGMFIQGWRYSRLRQDRVP
jgi:eukaryotic-like serine/threonine-protein kinase